MLPGGLGNGPTLFRTGHLRRRGARLTPSPTSNAVATIGPMPALCGNRASLRLHSSLPKSNASDGLNRSPRQESGRRRIGFYPSRGAKWLVPRRRESLSSAREQDKPFALIRTAFPSSRFIGPSKKSVLQAPRRVFPESFDAGMGAFWSFSTGCQGSISTCLRPEEHRPGPFPPWAFRRPARRRSATRWPRWRRFAGPSG